MGDENPFARALGFDVSPAQLARDWRASTRYPRAGGFTPPDVEVLPAALAVVVV